MELIFQLYNVNIHGAHTHESSLEHRLNERCITLSAIINFPHYRDIIQVLPRAVFRPGGGPVMAIRSSWARTYSRGPPSLSTEKTARAAQPRRERGDFRASEEMRPN